MSNSQISTLYAPAGPQPPYESKLDAYEVSNLLSIGFTGSLRHSCPCAYKLVLSLTDYFCFEGGGCQEIGKKIWLTRGWLLGRIHSLLLWLG